MLSAAVCGDVFASPPSNAVLAAIRAVASIKGVLVIVKNYTGDRLSFGLAVELGRAEGIQTEMVLVSDDCCVDMAHSCTGPRGLAGTMLVHKVAGAAAAAGMPLASVAEAARSAARGIATMGVSLSSCVVPGRAPSFELPSGRVELGLPEL